MQSSSWTCMKRNLQRATHSHMVITQAQYAHHCHKRTSLWSCRQYLLSSSFCLVQLARKALGRPARHMKIIYTHQKSVQNKARITSSALQHCQWFNALYIVEIITLFQSTHKCINAAGSVLLMWDSTSDKADRVSHKHNKPPNFHTLQYMKTG